MTQNIRHHFLSGFFFICLVWSCCLTGFLTGCGGGGGGNGDGGSSGNLELTVIPAKLSHEGGGDSNGLFASAKGGGVTGGRIENPQNVYIVNSDLRFENATFRYEILLEGSQQSLLPGEYTLKYYVNGETKDYKSKQIEWTTIPGFGGGIVLYFNPSSRDLTVSTPNLPGDVRYQLELYDADIGALRRQTKEFISGSAIAEYVPESGKFRVALIGNVYESGVIKSKAIYYFRDPI